MKALLIGVTLLVLSQSIFFGITIPQSSVYCFSELIPKNTPFHLRTTSTNVKNYTAMFMLQNGSILSKREGQSNVKKIDSYSAASMQYNFCIENHEVTDEFEVSFHHGLELADLTQLPQMEDMKLVQQLVQLIEDTHDNLDELHVISIDNNEYSMEVQKLISFKTVGFGFLSIAVILIVSFLHYLEIKRALRNRKII